MRYDSAAEYIFGFGSNLAQPVLAGWRPVKGSVALCSSPCLWKTLHNGEENLFFCFFLLLYWQKPRTFTSATQTSAVLKCQPQPIPRCHTCWHWSLRPFRAQWLPLVAAGGTMHDVLDAGRKEGLCPFPPRGYQKVKQGHEGENRGGNVLATYS